MSFCEIFSQYSSTFFFLLRKLCPKEIRIFLSIISLHFLIAGFLCVKNCSGWSLTGCGSHTLTICWKRGRKCQRTPPSPVLHSVASVVIKHSLHCMCGWMGRGDRCFVTAWGGHLGLFDNSQSPQWAAAFHCQDTSHHVYVSTFGCRGTRLSFSLKSGIWADLDEAPTWFNEDGKIHSEKYAQHKLLLFLFYFYICVHR